VTDLSISVGTPAKDTSKGGTENLDGGAARIALESDATRQQAQQVQDQQEKKILGKFATQADLEKAYTELEKKLGVKGDNTQQKTDEGGSQTDESTTTTKIGSKATDKTPLLSSLAQEFLKDGTLSDSSKAKLSRAGLTLADFDVYVEGQKAVAAQQTKDLASVVGGEEQFKATLEWAKDNLEEAEIAAYNTAIEQGNMTLAKMLLRSIGGQRTTALGQDGSLVSGGRVPGNAGVVPYASIAQLTEDQRDPRYKIDPAFRAQVMQRLRISEIM
jgi:hypothetical protein